MIRAEHVTKRFGRHTAVDDVSFVIERGQAVALWGSNGAGKTTLIRCLLGVLRHHGEIRVEGLSARRQGKRVRGLIGYVPQELAFHDDMRLGTALLFFARLRGVRATDAAARLARVGLHGHERKRVRDLSGGMKQRLALAVAMLADPPIIVLDEPTSNLDAAGRSEVVSALKELKRTGKTIVFASHRPDEVMALADRVFAMEGGRVERDASPAALWPSEAHGRLLRLHVAKVEASDAASVLREAGHTVRLNGQGLCVCVSGNAKAAPIRTLARANMEVTDFELLDDVRDDEGASQ